MTSQGVGGTNVPSVAAEVAFAVSFLRTSSISIQPRQNDDRWEINILPSLATFSITRNQTELQSQLHFHAVIPLLAYREHECLETLQ